MKKKNYFLWLTFLISMFFLNGCAGIIPPLPPNNALSPNIYYVIFTITTPENVEAGSEIIAKVIYDVVGSPPEGIVVVEKSVLLYKGEELTTLDNTTIIRKNGRYVIEYSFTVPAKAAKGEYTIRQELSAPKIALKKESQSFFSVTGKNCLHL